MAESRLTPPSAIVFDVGGTLLETVGSPHHQALRAFPETSMIDADSFARAVGVVAFEWREAGGHPAEEDLAETWAGHYARALARVGYVGDARAMGERIEANFLTSGWRVFDDSEPVLAALTRRNIPLAVISNWPPSLEASLIKCGLRQYFNAVIVSGNVGYAKPHPAIFQLAVERLGVPAAQSWYVGDSISHDVQGARSAGFHPILLDRRARHPDHPDRIETLSALLALLDGAD